MRRGADDKKWQATREAVKERDQGVDRLMKVLTYKEGLIVKRKAGPMKNVLDPAHYIPVSKRPDLCYDVSNIVLLNRYSHEALDSSRDPVTNEWISNKQVQAWWKRILKGDLEQYDSLKKRGLIEED